MRYFKEPLSEFISLKAEDKLRSQLVVGESLFLITVNPDVSPDL